MYPNEWVRVGNCPYSLVATSNARWVNWSLPGTLTLPDPSYVLQTNTVGVGVSNAWSTNHGLPAASTYSLHKGILVKPGDLPDTRELYFRLCKPGY